MGEPREPVSERVFRSLVGDILSGRYGPGEKLPTQRGIAADFGVNMGAVREAIKRLEQMHLITVRHGDAMRVLDWRQHGGLDILAHVVFQAGELHDTALASVLEARRGFLAGAATMAAERRSDEDAAHLAAIAGMLAREPPVEEAQVLDLDFYSALVSAAGNLVFSLIFNSIRSVILSEPASFRPVVARLEGLVPLYEGVASAVEAGDQGAAFLATDRLARAQEERIGEVVAGLRAAREDR